MLLFPPIQTSLSFTSSSMKNTAFSPPPPPTSLYPTPHHHHHHLLLLFPQPPSIPHHLFLKTYNPHPLRHRSPRPLSAASDKASELHQWDSMTARFAAASNVPFLLIQLPQILLNARNLLSGNRAALLAVPWLGMLTGLLGNLTLLSYFAKKRESEAIVVQTLGVVSIFVVLAQLAAAGAMARPVFSAISAVVLLGLVLNFMNYFGRLDSGLWLLWEDFITVSGLSVLPQVMWSTFVPSIPNSILPGIVSCTVGVAVVAMARIGKLPEDWVKFVRSISGWTATLLFMWMPIAQMWTTYLNPDNIKGLSALTILLGMIGNALMIPRALFIRDLMWFTGASWASILHGWGNLACMYFFDSISSAFFFPATLSLFLWIGAALWRDTAVYGYNTPLKSLRELAFGR
ncbi:maltose excess protein 1-like, chloroplastic [Ananas comosus]|uniref:Maltose excess protein 1-like, chloroplastic n=1 Tax=Ananas comosus TaxID=4615 RepID=A0A6P5H6T6_ANACO|nr:maltose excess protein 1-like, chloroplastic [Ananas comosus]XP_020113203.1 maltose excess protein 1-like, chloroplastic [Ananas comosus]XP_020113204.1 maltose excess protein 1-like, chloroplastic [Ananas comosus]